MGIKFKLGQVVVTPGIQDLEIPYNELYKLLNRHQTGDWEGIQKEECERALKDNGMILSEYKYNDTKIWIITEWDRSVTTLLLPEEY
jgi:hypothetical protein